MDSAPSYNSQSQPPYAPYPTDKNAGAYPPPVYPNAFPPQNPPYPNSPTPGAAYYQPTQPGASGMQQQQQQQSVTVVNVANAQPATVIVQSPPLESYVGYIVFGCLVFWCCNPLFGLIAFILAIVADNTKHGDRIGARRLGKASLWLSITGIIVTCIIIAIAVGVSVGTATKNCAYAAYTLNGICFSSRRYAYGMSSCYGTFSSCCYSYEDLYYNGYCYNV